MNLLCAFNLCLFAFRSEPEYKNHEEESNVEWENSQLDICLIYEYIVMYWVKIVYKLEFIC